MGRPRASLGGHLACLALCLSLSTARPEPAVGAAEEQPSKAEAQFLAWLAEQGATLDAVEIFRGPRGRGLRATRPVAFGEPLFQFPAALYLDASQCKNPELCEVLRQLEAQGSDLDVEHLSLVATVVWHTLSSDSFYSPYLNFVAEPGAAAAAAAGREGCKLAVPDLPAYWDLEEQEAFHQGVPALQAALRMHLQHHAREVARLFEHVFRPLEQQFETAMTWLQFMPTHRASRCSLEEVATWANVVVGERAWGPTPTPGHYRNRSSLIPIWDLANHDEGSPYYEEAAAEGAPDVLVMRSRGAFDPGDEVAWNYWGAAPSGRGPCADSVAMEKGFVPTDPLRECHALMVNNAASESTEASTQTFLLFHDGALPEKLLIALRRSLLNERDAAHEDAILAGEAPLPVLDARVYTMLAQALRQQIALHEGRLGPWTGGGGPPDGLGGLTGPARAERMGQLLSLASARICARALENLHTLWSSLLLEPELAVALGEL